MPEHTISENLERLVDAKTAIVTAITDMGGTVNSGDGFEEFSADIATIPSGGDGESLPLLRPGVIPKPEFGSSWSKKTWYGLTSFDGSNVWTDGTNIYYSSGSQQYVLDKATSTWSQKTWTGLTSFEGKYIWTDGTDIYYSYYNSYSSVISQYVLNKETSTWSEKTWSGFALFSGNDIWTDGTDIYCSHTYPSNQQYVLDKATSTWLPKTWNGVTSLNGSTIWTDGVNIYGASSHVLNKATSTWSGKEWYGKQSFSAGMVWTDGTHFYLSYKTSSSDDQYVGAKRSSSWSKKDWGAYYIPTYGNEIWTDGTDIYCSDGSTQYVLNKFQTADIPTTKCVPGYIG